ncbi:MAG: alpha/beta hydrolase [Bacteroidota bacterium]
MKNYLLLPFFLSFFVLTTAQNPFEATSYQTISDILYRDAADGLLTDYMKERCKLDLYYPDHQPGFATVVWFHGGGIRAGNKFIPQELQEKGIAVVAVNYRLSPKVKSPAYIEDAAASVAWVFRHIEEYGGDPNLIFVSGHSAGGYLSSMIGLDKQYLEAFDIDADKIAGLIPYSGHAITHFTVRSERGIDGKQPILDEMAPLYHIRQDAPPYIIITGDREQELLGRYEENAYMMRMMKVVGHPETYLYELDGYNHGGMAVPAHHILLTHVKQIIRSKK